MRAYQIKEGSGGSCFCGHRQKIGEMYWLVETHRGTFTYCEKCGTERGLTGPKVTFQEMANYWWKGEKMKEVVCRHLPRLVVKSKNSSKREERLRVAVSV